MNLPKGEINIYNKREEKKEQPFGCDKCNQCFISKVALKQHSTITHSEVNLTQTSIMTFIKSGVKRKKETQITPGWSKKPSTRIVLKPMSKKNPHGKN